MSGEGANAGPCALDTLEQDQLLMRLRKLWGRYRQTLRVAGHDRSKEDVAIAFPVYVTESATQVPHEVEASFLTYFQAIIAVCICMKKSFSGPLSPCGRGLG